MNSGYNRIKTYNNEIEAKMDSQILKENGIDSFIRKDDSGSMRPPLQTILGVELFVKNEDVEKAEEVLTKFEKS